MTTCQDLIEKVRTRVLAGTVEERNAIKGNFAADATQLVFSRPLSGLQPRTKLTIGQESLYVWDVNPTSKTADVARGLDGTTPAAISDGAMVTVNARFPDWQIFQALNDCINSYEARGFYRMIVTDLTSIPAVYGYDITGSTDVSSVYKVAFSQTGPEHRWPRLRFDWDKGLPASDFPSGNAIFIRDEPEPGRAMRIWYKAPFSPFASVGDDFTAVTGMPANTSDIPVLGAAAYLLGAREGKRAFDESEGDSRKATEVPPGSMTRAAMVFQQQHDQRLADEIRKLQQQYPDLLRSVP